ncbi:MAG: BMP family ABC transporter substrate-binding protein [Oscillospiraceae bacterium]|nr:BMP family ABC transporter substrate-binding protein [Oscillospiraceae bacterium]
MKKMISLVLSVAMVLMSVMVLTNCGPKESDEKLKVAVVLAGATGDRSFYDSANEGLQQLIKRGDVQGSLIECQNDASMFTTNLISAAENNDVVVAVGWEFWEALAEYAPQLPDTKFIFVDNGLDGVGDNLLSITYAQNEGSFLVGYIAGKLSTTGKVGAIGGEDSETINDFIVGYEAGAKYANPNAVVQTRYAGTYEDPARGKELALALYDSGCDIVFQVASRTGEGVFEAAAERGLFAIGVDSDQKYINPDVIICSMVKEVGQSIVYPIAGLLDNGTWNGGHIWVADMSTGMVDVGYGDPYMTQQVDNALKAEVEQIKADIISGKIEVPTAFR